VENISAKPQVYENTMIKILRLFLYIFIIAGSSFNLYGQNLHTRSNRALKSYTEGKRAYDYVEYKAAEEYLLDATERDNNFIEAFLLLAELYKDQKRYKESADKYERVIEIDSMFFIPALYSLGEVRFMLGNYIEAAGSFMSFLAKDPDYENLVNKSKAYLVNCEFAIEEKKHPVPFTPVSLGEAVNTEFDEYWPAITVDNSLFFFTRQISEGARNIDGIRYQEDFYFSVIQDSVFLPAKNIGHPLNTPFNEGALSLAAGGQYLYFTACNRMDGRGGCDIYYSALTSRGWIKGMNIGSPVNTRYWESQPSLSSDGQKLYFTSNRPGGYGGMDIWCSKKTESGEWTEPFNLGKDINTPGNEMSPFIHFDGRTLYFSSNGRPSMGGLDLYMSKMILDTIWTEVENLGYPINTQMDEMGLIINGSGDRAYYSSEINAEQGRDLFYFNLPETLRPDPVSYIKGTVYDKLSGRKIRAQYELIDINNKTAVLTSATNEGGEFLICLTSGKNYGLNVNKKNYLFYSESFFLEGDHSVAEPFILRIGLSPIKVGEKMTLYNVFYETDSWELLSESLIELNRLYELLTENENIVIEVGGHTDSSGSDEHNQLLSQRRAESVKDYLISKGINSDRISHRGDGDTMPVSDNDTSEGRRRNRRTEIKITGTVNLH
jgi:hypothetical protein